MSRPTVVTVCMFGSSESWGLNSTHYLWHSCAGGGAVHSITSGLMHRSKRHHLFNDFVGAQEERLGDRQPDRLCRLVVDHQLELDRGLDRKFARLRTLEDAIGIGRREPKITEQVTSVGQQAAEFSEDTGRGRRQGDGSAPPAR